jgi:hypothetical protein
MEHEVQALSLRAVTDRALSWIESNLDRFDPFRRPFKPNEFRPKALVELALLACLLRRQPAFADDDRVSGILRFALRVYHTPFFRDSPFRLENAFPPRALLAAILRVCGLVFVDRDWDAIQVLVTRSNVCSPEQVPHRLLELRHLLDLGGFEHRLPSYPRLFRSSLLRGPLNLAYVTDFEAYSVTHTIFYLSDFGSRPLLGPGPADLDHAVWLVDHLLGMYTRRGNWDLVAELLLSLQCLGRTSSILYGLGWRALVDAQTADGMVPGPQFDPGKREAAGRECDLDHVFGTCYHTTLIAAMAGALCRVPAPTGERTDPEGWLETQARARVRSSRRRRMRSRLAGAVSLSRAWLLEVAIEGVSARGANLGDLIRAQTGIWIADRCEGRSVRSTAFCTVIENVVDRLKSETESGTFDAGRHDSKLLFLCLSCLKLNGHHAFALEMLARDVSVALDSLARIPPRYVGEAVLLSQLEYLRCPWESAVSDQKLDGGCRLLRAGKDGIRDACDLIAAATHFGQIHPRTNTLFEEDLGHLLSIILLQALRDYDLELGAMLVRALTYLRVPRTQAVDDALEFLVSQQQADGRFGYFAMEVEAMERAGQPSSSDPSLSLYLPITVSCLWTLGEALVPDFNLFTLPNQASS